MHLKCWEIRTIVLPFDAEWITEGNNVHLEQLHGDGNIVNYLRVQVVQLQILLRLIIWLSMLILKMLFYLRKNLIDVIMGHEEHTQGGETKRSMAKGQEREKRVLVIKEASWVVLTWSKAKELEEGFIKPTN